MKRVGWLFDPIFFRHHAGDFHPECPQRLEAIMNKMSTSGLVDRLVAIAPRPAGREWLERNHTPAYVSYVEQAYANGIRQLDPDTGINESSRDAAFMAAGAGLAAVDAVMKGELEHAFCAVRPPGHHAEADRAMGFCLFNNVAVAARYALASYSLQRIVIMDWDVHHGNGTQHSFYENPDVFYISIHQWPHYPGTGRADERGKGAGEGTTLNIPLPAGSGDDDYLEQFATQIIPAIHTYHPDLILISAGFDAHTDDFLANMKLSTDGFAEMTRMTMAAAHKLGHGRIVSMLEGGYNLTALAECVYVHLEAMLENTQ